VNGTVKHRKQVNGEYEKVKEGRYSSGLIDLMERMMDSTPYTPTSLLFQILIDKYTYLYYFI
jgi:hypothetical protein